MIFGNAERMKQALLIQAPLPGGDRGDAQCIPGPGRMIVRRRRVLGNAGADRDLVTDNEGGQELGA